MSRLSPERQREICEFWLGPLADELSFDPSYAERWFKKDAAFDEEIRQRFGRDIEQAIAGELDASAQQPTGRLALVLLLDQLTRNAYRDSPRMYDGDERALRLAHEGFANGHAQALPVLARTFLAMPLMHSEALVDQQACVARFEELLAGLPPEAKGAALGNYLATALDYARRHEHIVARFGRFPHRNALLGRTSSDEEVVFLTEPGSSF